MIFGDVVGECFLRGAEAKPLVVFDLLGDEMTNLYTLDILLLRDLRSHFTMFSSMFLL